MAVNMKRLLANALIALCAEKPLEKITITEIVKKACTGRQTFYNHFKDKNDLIYWIFLKTLSGERRLVETSGFYAYLRKLYSEAQRYADFLMQACKLAGQNSLAEAICQQTYNYYRNYILEHYGSGVLDRDLEYALRFNAYGASSLYVRWAEEGMPGSAEEQARNALRCMPLSMKAYLPLSAEERAL